jgi:hypothetical protein
MRVLNVHERVFRATPEQVGAMLDALSREGDPLWPRGTWPAVRFDRPLGPGAAGGHGDVRYVVETYQPGRFVRFRFRKPCGFDGVHYFEVQRRGRETALRHVIEMTTHGFALLSWPLLFGPLHDALIEDAFDNVEDFVSGDVKTPARWSWYVRFLRGLYMIVWTLRGKLKLPAGFGLRRALALRSNRDVAAAR